MQDSSASLSGNQRGAECSPPTHTDTKGPRGVYSWAAKEAGSPDSPVAGDPQARVVSRGQNLPVYAMDRVRLVMVPSLLVSHVNW